MDQDVESKVIIADYEDRYAAAFAELNYAWIEKYYSVEPHDREILDDPLNYIIYSGGHIFFALLEDRPIGTVALLKAGDRSFELAKMAVSPEAQGRGVGARLIDACIDYAATTGKAEIFLESNTRQEAALHLYRKAGFQETDLDPNSLYSRANIRMRLAL